MNIIWGDNYIDATNELIGGSGDTIIQGGTGNISDYIYISSNSNLIINNPNTYGETRFVNLFTNGNSSRNHNVKIDYFGKLQVYHPYSLSSPTVLEGWKDVESEIAGLIFGVQASVLDIIAVQGQIAGIDAELIFLQSKITGLEPFVTAINANMEAMHYGFYSQSLYEEMVQNNFSTLINQIPSLVSSFRDVAFNTRVSQFIGGLVIPAAAGSVIGFFANHLDNHNLYVTYSNALNSNQNLTPSERKQLLEPSSNIIRQNYISFNSNFCNMNLEQGFVNSNIITRQVVPYLRSNKIEIGNITTPNSAYQLEMTGDLNTNMLWINSTSLTSLLNQKQNNMNAVSPIYITTGNIGLTYDSSLTKVGNNLSVVKTATAPLKWTGNDISIDYDSTLLLTSGTLGVSIGAESKWSFSGGNIYNKALTNVGIGTLSSLTSKLNVNGDIYTSSNINCGVKPLNFISAYSGQSAFALATGTNEYYIEFNSGGGTLILSEPCAVDILCVGGGGNGGIGPSSGGGGSGEVIYFNNFPLRAGTLNIQVGSSSTNPTNRISRIYPTTGNEIMRALGGGNGGSTSFYSTSGGTVSSLTAIAGTNDAYISITAGTTTLTLNANCTVDILIVGGGGAGGRSMGGGGGAGGVVYVVNQTLNAGTYSLKVGAGGVGEAQAYCSTANDGNESAIMNSSQTTYISMDMGGTSRELRGLGGGAGGAYCDTSLRNGRTGGSGGGAAEYNWETIGTGASATQPATMWNGTTYVAGGTSGHSTIVSEGSTYFYGGGGGGAGGTNFNNDYRNGKTGVSINITGTSVIYAAGGGPAQYGGEPGNTGSTVSTSIGLGGNNIGGQGEIYSTATNVYLRRATSGNANTGSGGGGIAYTQAPSGTAGSGGSGVIIIRFRDYQNIIPPTSGGSGGGGAKNQIGASPGTKFDEYKSFVLGGLNGTSTNGGNGGSGNTTYNTRYTTNITGTSLSVGLGGSGATPSSTPTVKSNYGDGGDGNNGVGYGGLVIIRFKDPTFNLHLKAIKDNANTGLIINANETVSGTTTPYQLRIFPWSDTYTSTGVPTRGWSFRTHDGLANQDLINLFSYFGGRVGIKTKNPSAVLDVNGDIQCKTFNIIGNELYGVTCQIVNQNANGEASFGMYAGQGTSYGGLAFYYLPSDNLGYISCSKNLRIKTGNDAANSYIHFDNTYGYIGVGKTDPVSKLDVNGTLTTNFLSSSIIYAGEVQSSIINNLNGNLVNNNNLFTSNIYVYNAIDMQNKPINNCSYLYGGCSWTNELKLYTNYYHKDDQGRDRIYFKNDTTGSPANHFTLFKSGGTTHSFSDKDDVQYCLLERFGLTTYFEVISGGGYDNVGVLDGVNTGTYVFRKMYLRLSTFTEVHRCFIEDELYNNYDDFINQFIGRIVISKGKIKTALKQPDKDWEILEGKDGITIDDSHPVIELSRKKKDKAVVGVITKRNQNSDMPARLVINSLGETACWVVNKGGNIENGDLITTSDEIGYGEKQTDDIIHNYTIGKSMIDCNFELDNPNYKCEDLGNGLRRAFLPIFIYSG